MLYFINFAVSSLIGKISFNRGIATALVYGTVMRNLSIAIAMIIAIAYIIQVQSVAWYVKFTDKIFGSNDTDFADEVCSN